MRHKKNMALISLLLYTIILSSCSDTVEPTLSDASYVPLKVGDERQIVFAADSSTIFYKVNGTATRSDGMKVYSYAWYYGTDSIPGISYYALKDGFFISTELDTTRDTLSFIPDNPFREQRLAKLFPNNGDTWQSIPGDSNSNYFVAADIGTQHTFAGTFNNCYSFKLGYFLSVNYSKGIGHISSIFLPDSTAWLASYIKVNSRIYGSKLPARDPNINDHQLKELKLKLTHVLFGQK